MGLTAANTNGSQQAANGNGSLAISVIVPATDRRLTLARCLTAIDAARSPDDEVIVVDQAGLPGPASARNRGATAASRAILVFVDSDVELLEDALSLIRDRFASAPDLAGVFGSYDDDPEQHDLVSTFRNLLHHYVHNGAAGRVGSFWAGIGAVRRDAFEQVGGFDERILPASVEDIEFGARLAGAGRIELDPAIQGKHLKRWTLTGMVRTDFWRRGLPWTLLALRGRATCCELNLSWRHRLSAASSLVTLLSIARGRPLTAAFSLANLCLINRRFYRLLARRGRGHLIGGIGLHVIHHLTCALAAVVGVTGLLRVGRVGAPQPLGGAVAASQTNKLAVAPCVRNIPGGANEGDSGPPPHWPRYRPLASRACCALLASARAIPYQRGSPSSR